GRFAVSTRSLGPVARGWSPATARGRTAVPKTAATASAAATLRQEPVRIASSTGSATAAATYGVYAIAGRSGQPCSHPKTRTSANSPQRAIAIQARTVTTRRRRGRFGGAVVGFDGAVVAAP